MIDRVRVELATRGERAPRARLDLPVPSTLAWCSLLEWMPSPVIATTGAGTIALANAAAARLFGYTRGDLVGQMSELLVPDWLGNRRGARNARPGASGGVVELSGRHRDGSRFPIEVRFTLIRTSDGTLVASAIQDLRPHLPGPAARTPSPRI